MIRFEVIYRYLGLIFLLNAAALTVSAIVSLIMDGTAFLPLLYSAFVVALFGGFPLIFVPRTQEITNNEGLIIVVGSWLLSCAIGMLPFLLSGGEFTLINAWFESVSGYTTTGASILTDIESVAPGILFWRSMTHWLGGMGIILFALSILPLTGESAKVLYQSEISSLAVESFRQRTREAIRILISVYLGLTVLETLTLLLCGMTFYDAMTHSFATIATGGFSPKNASIAAFQSPTIEWVIIVFMIMSGIHFAKLFSIFAGHPEQIWRSTVVKYYLSFLGIGVALTTILLHGETYPSWSVAFRYAAFQVISIGTSTGFATTNSAVWPAGTHLILIFFSLQCACAGSTSGGIKADRLVLAWKAFRRQILQLRHPHAVLPIAFGNRTIADSIVGPSILYIVVYVAIALLATLVLVFSGDTALEAFSGVVASMGNVGPGLGAVGSTGNYAGITQVGKIVLTMVMLLGRLELYAIIMLFSPTHWRKYPSF